MNSEAATPPREDLFVPDRFEQLRDADLRSIVVPVDDALEAVGQRIREMRGSRRGALMILLGDTGSGKSTFLDTAGFFLNDVTTVRIPASADVAQALNGLPETDRPRIVVLEGREALRDVPAPVLEGAIHAINSFVRDKGLTTLVVWPANTEGLAGKLAELAQALGGEALIGTGEPVQRFAGPPRQGFVRIGEQTVAALNEGASLAALGVSEQRAGELAAEAPTIGRFLALVRDDLLGNWDHVHKLLEAERPRMWILVIAGNDAERDVAALTRGGLSYADIDRLLTATDANVAKELREVAADVGILGSVLDARILSIDIVAVLAIAREFGDDALHRLMRAQEMSTTGDGTAGSRLEASELGLVLRGESLGLRKTGRRPGPNTIAAYGGLAEIARTNDIACNRAIARALEELGHIRRYDLEKDLGGGLTRRTDIYCETDSDPIRLEVMWRKQTSRADIAQYALGKLRNYGKAVGLLERA